MSWAEFYLYCFLVGFGLTVVALLVGSPHLHLPHAHLHLPHAHGAGGQAPWFNFGTLAAFLAWFGGTGYLMERYGHVWFLLALGVSLLSGLAGAAIVFWFLARVLMRREAALDPADYDMVGVLGRLSISIRPGGTGEIIYSQEGTRHVAGARSEENIAIAKGSEVIVTRYEKGIAYVRPWQDELERK